MSLNIIDLIKGQLGPALVSQAATQLGESESGISKAISGLLPAVLGGLVNNSNNSSVVDSITGAASSGLLSNLLGGTSNNSLITSVLTAIFGDKIGGLVQSVSSFAGISESSSNSLLNMVTGATLGSVGKYASDNNLDGAGISSLLSEQKTGISSLLPAGLSLGSLGLGSLFGGATDTAKEVTGAAAAAVTGATDKVTDTAKDVAGAAGAAVSGAAGKVTNTFNGDNNNDNGGGGSFWKWLLPLLLLIAGGWFLWKQCEKKETTTTVESELVEMDSANAPADSTGAAEGAIADVTRETTTVTLPDGKTLNAFKGGIEDQVIAFLNSDEYKNADEAALKGKWFNFDNLNFEFGTTTLTPESKVQLENLKAILAAFPDAKIKIGAYTDKKGDDAGNLKLSQSRADAVKAAVNSPQVLEAKGYGEEIAKVDENASDKEREADRKTAIRFVK